MKYYSIHNKTTASIIVWLESKTLEKAQLEAAEYLKGNEIPEDVVIKEEADELDSIDYLHKIEKQ